LLILKDFRSFIEEFLAWIEDFLRRRLSRRWRRSWHTS